ncbi:MAG: hypothetical protein JRG92_07480 [Deltaproteobacteria bacterium]|nr:hypothetical protein [Deltaproteobacteria bacterium]MBW2696832.1 hypothetical protein [Deltaproteobacteria bacterium]
MANQVTRILWAVLMCAQVLFVVAAFFVARPHEDGIPAHVPILAGILAVISISTALGTAMYRRSMLVRPIQEGRLDPRTQEGLAAAFPHFMLTLALSESVGIYGLVLAILSGQAVYCIPFAAAAAALLFFHRPMSPALNPPPTGVDRALDSTPIG